MIRWYQLKIQESTKRIPIIGKKTIHLNECFWMMANEKKTLFKCIGSSLVAHNFGILAFFTITSPFYGTQINFLDIFSIVPIGMIITAIPISPGGLGVGHAAFEKLFQYFYVMNGANLFNIFWIIFIFNNLLGVIP